MKEEWRRVKGYNDRYFITNNGNVYSTCGRLKLLKPSNSAGYLKVSLNVDGTAKQVVVHRLVAEYFLPNWDSKLEVNHKDFNKHNNSVENLEMVTSEQNYQHAKDNNRLWYVRGSARKAAKITEDDVKFIRESTLARKELAQMFGIVPPTVSKIRLRTKWRHVT